ncbi:MAG: metallophosphoesterase [Blastocatellia bacterium]
MIKLSAASVATVGLGALSYGALVRQRVEVSRVEVRIARLPGAFAGLTIAHLSDIHHGPYTSRDYIRRCIEMVNEARPDLVVLTGDFTFGGRRYVEPCAELFRELKPRIGVYAVLGNHDYYVGASFVARALRNAGCNLLIDAKERLEHRGDRLWLLGVDDFYYGNTDLPRLMRDVGDEEARIVLSHNPDYIEEFAAKRRHADLMLSGHTHGGQIRFPLVGAPQISSYYGQRYAIGMNRKDAMQIYTTRGIGTVFLPTRFDCPPEIVQYKLIVDG